MNYRRLIKNLLIVRRAMIKQGVYDADAAWVQERTNGSFVSMGCWVSESDTCGTAACAVGSMYLHEREHFPEPEGSSLGGRLGGNLPPVFEAFAWGAASVKICDGQTALAHYLFTSLPASLLRNSLAPQAMRLSGHQALRRIEKAIAYFQRRQDLWDTEPERLRRQEGDWGLAIEAGTRTDELVAEAREVYCD